MKKLITPLVVFLCSFAVCALQRPYTIVGVERRGLFLATPDFIHEIFSEPFPVTNLVWAFLSQFFKYPLVGALIISVGFVLAYLLLRFCVLRILLSVVSRRYGWICIACESVLAMAASLVVALNPDGQYREKWEKIEYAACTRNWDLVARTATPQLAAEMPQVTPFALLAWNEKGLLLEKMPYYPVSPDFGLNFGDEIGYVSYLFAAIEARELGCPNEALHWAFQAGDCLHRGTSFGLLRMILQQSYARGDSSLVVKYCNILEHSTLHSELIESFRSNPIPQRICDEPSESSVAPLITSDPAINLYRMHQCGLQSKISAPLFKALKTVE